MRLPGTRYQEHGWEHVRKLLGESSLTAFVQGYWLPASDQLDPYTESVAAVLRSLDRRARVQINANSYGDSVHALALLLLCELGAHRSYWLAFVQACEGENLAKQVGLRKRINDMYAGLRDKVDADNYQVACGRPCSPNKIYAYRMLDMAYADIARVFANWQDQAEQVAAILGRPVAVMPIEVRQMKSIVQCKGEWIINWSAAQAQFGNGPGPLHTRSKRFAALKDNPAKIALMLGEIGEYEQLSANQDHDWDDAGTEWLDDYWRIIDQSEAAPGTGPDQILTPAIDDEPGIPDDAGAPHEASTPQVYDSAIASALSLPPDYIDQVRLAEDGASWTARVLGAWSPPVRLAVYLQLLGSHDDSYPIAWLDPATGELPTMAQLAALDQVSLPTLRKRRNLAIAELQAATHRPRSQA